MLEFDDLIDSSNIKITDMMKIAGTIEEHYENYDGFVVCHGTDTMAYTASCLSFFLENLSKTVVITGSQIPLSELRNDACDNLLGSLLVAGPFDIPEVCIFFGSKLIRGNRSQKVSSSRLQAFDSPNVPLLGQFDVSLEIKWDRIIKPGSDAFKLFKEPETNIAFIQLSPCLNIAAIEAVLKHSRAVLLAGYGMGNLPTDNKRLMAAI